MATTYVLISFAPTEHPQLFLVTTPTTCAQQIPRQQQLHSGVACRRTTATSPTSRGKTTVAYQHQTPDLMALKWHHLSLRKALVRQEPLRRDRPSGTMRYGWRPDANGNCNYMHPGTFNAPSDHPGPSMAALPQPPGFLQHQRGRNINKLAEYAELSETATRLRRLAASMPPPVATPSGVQTVYPDELVSRARHQLFTPASARAVTLTTRRTIPLND